MNRSITGNKELDIFLLIVAICCAVISFIGIQFDYETSIKLFWALTWICVIWLIEKTGNGVGDETSWYRQIFKGIFILFVGLFLLGVVTNTFFMMSDNSPYRDVEDINISEFVDTVENESCEWKDRKIICEDKNG